jgi:predicted MFS family arabinose efflux permease
MLTNQYNFDANQVTVTQVVANLGAMFGGTAVGYCSQIFGRRFSICVMCVIGGALLYPYTFTSGSVVAGMLKIRPRKSFGLALSPPHNSTLYIYST